MTKNKIFYGVCIFLVLLTIIFFLNLWYKFIPGSFIDKYVILLFFTIIGLSLLPFADKLKIGNFIEIERLKEKIEEVQLHQYLGEIIKSHEGDIFYYDVDGKHSIPDEETIEFLRTSKGEILVTENVLSKMKRAAPMDSVLKAEKINWNGKHIFVILNEKKYWVSPINISVTGIPGGDTNKLRKVTDKEIRLIPTGK